VESDPHASSDRADRDVETGRLLAAVAYLPGLSLIGLLGVPENRYVGFHARQGFLLWMVEIVAWIGLAIYDQSLGRIPVLGFLVGAVVKFAVGSGLLAATVYGVMKGASGERARIPILGDAVGRVPI
jgi:uncharacterized membrane protein